MQRNEWKFQYVAQRLAEAVRIKIDYHADHLSFWMKKREELMATIRSEGIEISEKIAIGYVHPKARDWDRGGEIMIRNDLKKGLTETFEKLAYHTGKRDTYDGWAQVLSANPESTLHLDIDDWLFFFGRDTELDGE